MENRTIEYTVPTELSLSAVKKVLSGQFSCSRISPHKTRCTYLDTFDWRIYADGAVLESATLNNQLSLSLIALDGGVKLGPILLKRQPRFVDDIPSSLLHRRLSPVVEMRTLLSQFEVLREIETLALLNRDGKTVVRLQRVSEKVSPEYNANTAGATTFLKVIPFRGYDKSWEKVVKILSKAFDLKEAESDFSRRTLDRLGRLPGDPSKLKIDLSPDMSADTALKQVLLHLLNTIEVNESGTKTNTDSEFLHDFRVAIRRSRSAFSQVKGVFSSQIQQRFTPELKWLAGITGPTRDLDVYLLTFEKYKNSLPKFQRDHIEPLRQFLFNQQKSEQEKMATFLASSRYRTLKREWRAFLESANAETTTARNAARPIREVVSERILQVFKLTVKEGRAIHPETPAEALHDLRKTCKKLRYLMELFQTLYPPKNLKILIKSLKVLQENLGDFQDLDVQAESLREFGQQMMNTNQIETDTMFAMGTLIAGLKKRQLEARQVFSVCFNEFDSNENQALFKDLFTKQRKLVTAVT
ncbi:CHAD domain-containing protein [Pseudomonadota bacterium]